MKTIRITNSGEYICDHFTAKEFFLAANPDQEYDIPKCLVHASDIVREWLDLPTKVTSTYRPNDTFGFHRYKQAIDLAAVAVDKKVETLEKFKEECLNYISGKGSQLISALRQVGITGFGIENTCIHLDCRTSHLARKDKYGGYTVFEFKMENGKILVNKSL